MNLVITPQRCAAAYEFVRVFPPFTRWKMPQVFEVTFRIANRKDVRGEYHFDNGHHIMISPACVHHMDTLVGTMAHEMIHLAQRVAKTDHPTALHNADWHKRADIVCKRMGWDRGTF